MLPSLIKGTDWLMEPQEHGNEMFAFFMHREFDFLSENTATFKNKVKIKHFKLCF